MIEYILKISCLYYIIKFLIPEVKRHFDKYLFYLFLTALKYIRNDPNSNIVLIYMI